MKISILFIGMLVSLQWGAQAQNGSYFQHQPYSSQSELDIYRQDIPADFIFLVNDPFQRIFSNPAKSFLIDRSYAATTLSEPDGGPVQAGVIIPGKWVISASFLTQSTRSNSDSFEATSEFTSYTQQGDLITESDDRTRFTDYQTIDRLNSGELRLTKTWQKGEKEGRALGIFVGISQQEMDDEFYFKRYYDINTERTRTDTLIQNTITDAAWIRDNIGKSTDNKFKAGLEYYRASEKGESSHKLYVHLTDFDQSINEVSSYRDTTLIILPSSTNGRVEVEESEEWTVIDAVPLGISYDGSINRALNLLGNDHLMLSLSGRYSQGDLNFNLLDQEQQRIFQSGQQVFSNSTTINFRRTNNESKALATRAALGYAIQKEGEDYRFFTGLQPYISYAISNDQELLDEGIRGSMKDSYREIGLWMPFYGHFQVTKGLSFWGGGQLHYHHFRLSSTYEQLDLVDPENANLPVSADYDVDTKGQSIEQSLYMGVSLEHRSGLSLRSNFRGDLGRISGWLVSLGYSFP